METKIKLTGWLPCKTPPVRNGIYECLCTIDMPGFVPREFPARFNAGEWTNMTHFALPGINFRPENFSWRGMRRWVLTISPPHGEPQYLHRVDLGTAELWGVSLLPATGFDSEAEALDFAAKLPLTRDAVAVLP